MGPQKLGKDLKLDDDTVTGCIRQHPDDITGQCCAILMEWRETDSVMGNSTGQFEKFVYLIFKIILCKYRLILI